MLKESCGVFGIYNHKDAGLLTYLGLYALQHRGQESAGIVTSDRKKIRIHKDLGLVSDVFNEEILKKLDGNIAIGHTRYSTTGSTNIKNVQPFLAEFDNFSLAVGHNGNLTNTLELHQALEKRGAIFQTTIDSEIILHLIAHSHEKSLEGRIIYCLKAIKGAFSLVLMTKDTLIGARDPYGFRPLVLGKLNNAYVLASETCALDLVRAKYVREVEPGEIIFIGKNGIKSIKPFNNKKRAFCIFEYIYFARPDSDIFGHSVYETRKRLGEQLAREFKVKADLVVPIPDSGNFAALGFAKKAKINYEPAIIRNHYIGRTFIEPEQYIRDVKVKLKLNPAKKIIKNKKVVLVEDSIVRGTTSKARIRAIKEAGAKAIHMAVSCPPIKFPCFYGIDFPTKKELIASHKSVEDIRQFLGLDSLKYLSLEGMLKSMPVAKNNFCTACFTGRYPTPLDPKISKFSLEK
jgi:amidophosphoribosyltransferase